MTRLANALPTRSGPPPGLGGSGGSAQTSPGGSLCFDLRPGESNQDLNLTWGECVGQWVPPGSLLASRSPWKLSAASRGRTAGCLGAEWGREQSSPALCQDLPGALGWGRDGTEERQGRAGGPALCPSATPSVSGELTQTLDGRLGTDAETPGSWGDNRYVTCPRARARTWPVGPAGRGAARGRRAPRGCAACGRRGQSCSEEGGGPPRAQPQKDGESPPHSRDVS